jgi:exoribonuclease R
MAGAEHRDHALERAVVDYVEAAMLAPRVGERFDAFVTEVDEKGATVQVCEPAVRARLDGHAELGAHVTVTLTEADPATRRVRYSTSPPDADR